MIYLPRFRAWDIKNKKMGEPDIIIKGTIYQITPTTRYSISIISKKATSVLEVAFSILIVVPF